MKYLGVDYGERKIGLSLAEGGLAYPLAVLRNKKGVLKKIKVICAEHAVSNIIVGLPEGKLIKKIKKFAQSLSRITRLPVDFEPETLTTQEAIDKMIQSKKGKMARRREEDAFAAAVILQNYLEIKAE
jgi:putative Holliday junction resolvase